MPARSTPSAGSARAAHNLYLDANLVKKAKREADKNRQSLSRYVETLMAKSLGAPDPELVVSAEPAN